MPDRCPLGANWCCFTLGEAPFPSLSLPLPYRCHVLRKFLFHPVEVHVVSWAFWLVDSPVCWYLTIQLLFLPTLLQRAIVANVVIPDVMEFISTNLAPFLPSLAMVLQRIGTITTTLLKRVCTSLHLAPFWPGMSSIVRKLCYDVGASH